MKLRFLLLFVAALALASCGGSGSAGDAHSHDEEGAHMHEDRNHEGHDHGSEAAAGETHQGGKEYTSAYVCPMHCEGSGAEEPGTCPVCGMDYVPRAEHITDGHMHE